MPKISRIYVVVLVLFLLIYFVTACKKYVYNAFILTPEVGIHLLKGNIYLSDLMKIDTSSSISFYEDENQLMHLVFEQNVDTITAVSFFDEFYSEDTLINDFIPLDFVNDFYEITTDLDARISFDDQIDIYKMDSIKLDSGTLMASLFADPNNFDSLIIEIPTFFDELGNPVMLNFSSKDFQSQKEASLTNGIIYLEPAANSSGLVNIKLHMKFSKKGRITIQKPKLQIYLYNLKINTFYGRFGDKENNINNSTGFIDKLDYFQNESFVLDINQPEIYLFFKNDFNIPFSFINLKLNAGNSWNKQSVTGLPKLINVSASTEEERGYGQEMLLPSTNIENIFGQFPDSIFLSGEYYLNPENKETLNTVCINDSLFFGIKGDLPLNLKISEITYQQYFDSVFTINKIKDIAESIKFRATFKNNLPVKLSARIYFVDQYKTIFAEGFKKPLSIQPASNKELYFETDLSNEYSGVLLDKILSSSVLVELKIETFSDGENAMVKFLSTQHISFDLYLYAETRIESPNL
jgi:hypothetical protein